MFIYGHWRTALIQEQGHPNQVLSLESHPICTSLHIHSPFSVLSPNPPHPVLPQGLRNPLVLSPAPRGSGQRVAGELCPLPGPSWAVLGLCSVPRLQLGQLQAPITSRVWLQVIAPAASGSPCLVLQTGNKSPRRSSSEVSIQGPPKRKQGPDPNVCPGQPLLKAPVVFFSNCSELSGQKMPLLIASAGCRCS